MRTKIIQSLVALTMVTGIGIAACRSAQAGDGASVNLDQCGDKTDKSARDMVIARVLGILPK